MSSPQANIGFILDPLDNVATLPWGGSDGAAIELRGDHDSGLADLKATGNIPPGHKIALRRISKGAQVLKYGLPIGHARRDIAPGEGVHVDNLVSRFSPDTEDESTVVRGSRTIRPDDLHKTVAALLSRAGALPPAAEDGAEHITQAEQRGRSTHGIRRIEALSKRLRAGGIDGSATPAIERFGSVVLIDGNSGLGHHTSRVAADAAIDVARETGVAIALVRNSSHFGYAGFYSSRIAGAGMVGLASSNGQILVGPPGALKPIFSNNPIAVSAPVGKSGIFEFDMATSVTSRAKIAMAAEAGKPIAAGIALDGQGQETTDAMAALAGTLLPLGGAKGFGFIAALEVLAGVLPGGAYADKVASKEASNTAAEGTSHFLMAIAPSVWGSEEAFRENMADLERRIKTLPVTEGSDPARLPGFRRSRLAEERNESGIPLDDASVELLQRLSEEAGLGAIPVMEQAS